MTNQDKVIKEVSIRTGVSQKKVKAIIMSQFSMVTDAMKHKKDVSIYIRGVGTFLSPQVKYRLIGKSYDTINANMSRKNKEKLQEEEPYEFN